MFSNHLSSQSVCKCQRTDMIGRVADTEPQREETINNTRASNEETNLINLLDDFCISPAVYKKEAKIDDLQIKELEKFLSATGTSNPQKPPYTKEQEKEFQKFFEKYEGKTKLDIITNTIEIKNTEAGASGLCMNEIYIGTPKVLVPKLDQEVIKEPIEDLIDEILLEKHLEKSYLRNPTYVHKDVNNLNKSKPSSPSCIGKNCYDETSDIINQIKSIPDINSKTTIMNDNNIYLTNSHINTKKELAKQHLSVPIEELVSKYNLKYLEAVEMDAKKFQKRNILKSDAEKKHLTRGPTLHDKAVFLPQLMKQLAEKKKSVVENRNLILDTDLFNYKPADINPSTKTVQNMRLPAENTNIQSRVTQAAHANTATSSKSSSRSEVTLKNIQKPETTSGSKNNQAIEVKKGGIYNSRFIHIDEIKKKREEILAEKAGNSIMVGSYILRSPQSLIADCNKDKYVAHVTGQLFNDFIHGK